MMMVNKKGQSMLISHAILIGITIMLVLVVVYALLNIQKDYQKFLGASEIEQVCFVMKNSIEKIYSEGKYLSPSNSTYGKIRIVLPQRAADLKYRARVENRTIYIETLADPLLNTSCKVGINASFSGFAAGGVTEIIYTEFSNGTRQIALVKVT